MTEQQPPYNPSLRLFVVISKAYKILMEHAIRDMKQHNLHPTEFTVLELLYHKGPTPLQQIAEKILIASGTITYVVDKLEKRGLLQRKACDRDRRVSYAVITEEGSSLLDDIFPKHIQAIEHAVKGLDPEEKEIAIQLIKKLGLEAQREWKNL